jgi:hypothetical protein
MQGSNASTPSLPTPFADLIPNAKFRQSRYAMEPRKQQSRPETPVQQSEPKPGTPRWCTMPALPSNGRKPDHLFLNLKLYMPRQARQRRPIRNVVRSAVHVDPRPIDIPRRVRRVIRRAPRRAYHVRLLHAARRPDRACHLNVIVVGKRQRRQRIRRRAR